MESINLDENSLDEYELQVKDYCLTNGLFSLNKSNNSKQQEHDYASHLPVTLFPTKLPAREFNYAINIQKDFNQLIFSISNDYEFLKEALKNVIQVDEFTNNLWNIYETVYNEKSSKQPISFAILRNDFMIDKNKIESIIQLSQIEINTISCSFGAATSNVARLHRFLLNQINSKSEIIKKHVENDNINMLANAMIQAWQHYENPEAKVLFLISRDERNIGDQRLLEYRCSELNPKLIVLRCSLSDVYDQARLDDKKRLFINNNEIAVVYFRAGYDPKDYPTQKEWDARLLIEQSFSIKCPNISTHLVGAKIVQQALCEPNVLEKFISDKSVAESIRSTFVDIYSINNENLDFILKLINDKSDGFVLKPQREGGGNNIYKQDIKKFVETIKDKKELMGYILMKLVNPYCTENYVIKAGEKIKKKKLISELGIYGVYISNGDKLIVNQACGYLLRSKPDDVNEGGVASGYSALDSIYLS